MGSNPTADLFENLFGGGGLGGGGQRRNLKGDDVESAITLDFLESCHGVMKSVKTNVVTGCKPCSGTGMKSGTKRSTCKVCKGSGMRAFQVQGGGFAMQTECNSCGGTGSTIPAGKECDGCGGVGKVRERKVQDVKVPAGTLPSFSSQPL
jgi:molecular chaperone DnaJ